MWPGDGSALIAGRLGNGEAGSLGLALRGFCTVQPHKEQQALVGPREQGLPRAVSGSGIFAGRSLTFFMRSASLVIHRGSGEFDS
jgi:hypothetical protein